MVTNENYSGFQLDEVRARNPVSLRNRVSQYLTQMKTAICALTRPAGRAKALLQTFSSQSLQNRVPRRSLGTRDKDLDALYRQLGEKAGFLGLESGQPAGRIQRGCPVYPRGRPAF
jgi:hypothetical protein